MALETVYGVAARFFQKLLEKKKIILYRSKEQS